MFKTYPSSTKFNQKKKRRHKYAAQKNRILNNQCHFYRFIKIDFRSVSTK